MVAFTPFTRHISSRNLTPLERMDAELIDELVAPGTILVTLGVIEDF